ncbi:MAG: TonB-dependent receptor [Tannerellaceae bacterium]|jgi:hypothetical protein|nr:TonB-dependent receptor [Tannerellaceae bacterium]
MKTRYSLKTLSILLLSGITVTLAAQEEQQEALNRELTLEREYNPSVQDANKVNTLPAVKEPVVTSTPVDYAILSLPADPEREINLLPAARILQDMDYSKRRGYATIGAGAYRNINADAGYHLLHTAKDRLNFFLSHRSTQGKVKYTRGFMKDQKVEANVNDNLGGLDFLHSFDASVLQLGAKYAYSAFNYYGLPSPSVHSRWPVPEIVDTKTNQVSQQLTATAALESQGVKASNYALGIDFTRFSYKYAWDNSMPGIAEHTAGARLKWFRIWGADQQIGIATHFNYFFYTLPERSTASFDNHLEGTLTPYYRIEGTAGSLSLGVSFMGVAPQGENDTRLFASPHFAGELRLGAKTLAYAKAGGEIRSNSAFMLARENRYVDPYTGVTPSRTWLDLTAGLRTAILPGFRFHLFGQYKLTDDDYFFIPYQNPEGFGNFSRVLSMDSKLLRTGIELEYACLNLFELTFKGIYNRWDEERNDLDDRLATTDLSLLPERKAYGRPSVEITAGLKVRPVEPLSLSLDYYRIAGRKALVHTVNEDMRDIDELNLTASYTFSDTFALWLTARNLLFKQYELIYGYPLHGFNLMAGISIQF